MKKKVSVLLAVLIMLGGCGWIKDLGEVDFDTDLIVNVPVYSAIGKSVSSAASINDYSFSGSAVMSLEENEDIEPYLEKLREIDLESLEVTFTGLLPSQTIKTLSLSVTGIGTICTQSNITSSNSTFTPEVDAGKLQQAGKLLKDEGSVTITINGTATGPVENIVSLIFAAKVTAGALD